jgi:hypothetical protein
MTQETLFQEPGTKIEYISCYTTKPYMILCVSPLLLVTCLIKMKMPVAGRGGEGVLCSLWYG